MEANAIRSGNIDARTILIAVRNAARMGLIPGAIAGECFFIPRSPKAGQQKRINCEVGYKGWLQLAYRSEWLENVHREVWLDGEDFDYWVDEKGPHLMHRPELSRDTTNNNEMRRRVLGAYCLYSIRGTDKPGIKFVTRKELDRVDSKANVWASNYVQMVLKTSIIRAAKLWPKTPAISAALHLEDMSEAGVAQPDLSEVMAHTRESVLAGIQAAQSLGVEPTGRPDTGYSLDDFPDVDDTLGDFEQGTPNTDDEPTEAEAAEMVDAAKLELERAKTQEPDKSKGLPDEIYRLARHIVSHEDGFETAEMLQAIIRSEVDWTPEKAMSVAQDLIGEFDSMSTADEVADFIRHAVENAPESPSDEPGDETGLNTPESDEEPETGTDAPESGPIDEYTDRIANMENRDEVLAEAKASLGPEEYRTIEMFAKSLDAGDEAKQEVPESDPEVDGYADDELDDEAEEPDYGEIDEEKLAAIMEKFGGDDDEDEDDEF